MNNLKGTKTEKNLMEAFAGESQARNKYTYYASKARKDGYEQIAAIFEETANNEKEHAKLWFKELHGGEVPTTLDNLKDAASGENYEWTNMYDRMAKEAKEALSYAEDVYCTRKIIRKRHIQRMKDGDCSPDIGVYFLDIISSMERIAGYAFTIARYILSQNDEEE